MLISLVYLALFHFCFTLQLSKSKRKKLKKKMKELETKERESEAKGEIEEPENQKADEVEISEDSKPSSSSKDNGDIESSIVDNSKEVDSSSSSDSCGPMIARKRFKFCDNCGRSIESRIQLCAGCKRVAYCNYACQKAKWKAHKKVCAYALQKDGKDSTG